MAKPTDRTVDCDSATRSGRLAKARQFMEAARLVELLADDADDVADAYVTLCVHAGIAAADVVCCRRLGRHARGENHAAAVRLLEQASTTAARHLGDLLAMKTKAGYSAVPASGTDVKRAGRAASALLDEAMQS
ncbi:MAG: hypothetical protein KDB37_14895 [Ilumatobacter sp.]|nr:hypothetical protein [Ilumatobacter sp.]